MFKWLRKKTSPQEWRTIQAQLNRLESLLTTMAITEKDPPVVIHHVHIDHPKLDHLTFHLDGIDIDDLSGTLNIGTNSGVSTEKTSQKKEMKQESVSKNKSSEELLRTPSGFRHIPK